MTFALVDGNNFYASVEAIFQPALRGKPLVVLSNNDGCAIARSAEAKSLGIKMGHPAHELRSLVRTHGLLMRSANFTLYGDMSARVLAILRDASPRVEPYSIDESFIDLSGVRDRTGFARELRDRIRRWTGVPNCIGIGPTKTLAKAANKLAKRGPGVVDLTDKASRAAGLADFAVGDVWGVGSRWEAKLRALGVKTAAALRDASPELIAGRFGVVLARTQRELQGHPCAGIEQTEPDRQQIMVSRSFGERVSDHAAIAEALATFAARATEKLRNGGLTAGAVWIFANSDVFRPELPQHHPSRAVTLPRPTMDTRGVLQVVSLLFRGFLRDGYAYKRAGVALLDLARPERLQPDMFRSAVAGDPALMATLDSINRKFGRGTAGFAATGWQRNPVWAMRQRNVSPRYTTRWSELPRAHC
jgi:DNA polymerase V